MKVTLKQLVKMDACLPAREEFEATFGKSVTLTARLVMKHAREFGWDIDFLVRGKAANAKFERLLDEYTAYFEDLPRPAHTGVFPYAMAAAFIELKKLPLGKPV